MEEMIEQEPSGDTDSTHWDRQRFLAFSIGNLQYAIPLLAVKEVIASPEVTPVPFTPPHFVGVMNLRGQVISVYDLRLKFHLKADKTQETAVIICDLAPYSVGVVVSEVNSVLSLRDSEIQPRPELEGIRQDCISGVTKTATGLVLLIDLAKALDLGAPSASGHPANTKKSA